MTEHQPESSRQRRTTATVRAAGARGTGPLASTGPALAALLAKSADTLKAGSRLRRRGSAASPIDSPFRAGCRRQRPLPRHRGAALHRPVCRRRSPPGSHAPLVTDDQPARSSCRRRATSTGGAQASEDLPATTPPAPPAPPAPPCCRGRPPRTARRAQHQPLARHPHFGMTHHLGGRARFKAAGVTREVPRRAVLLGASTNTYTKRHAHHHRDSSRTIRYRVRRRATIEHVYRKRLSSRLRSRRSLGGSTVIVIRIGITTRYLLRPCQATLCIRW